MLKVGALLKLMSDMNPQQTPARLALFNWLKSFAQPDDALSKELFELFFCDCLVFTHWVSNKIQLGKEVRFLLDNLNSFYQQKFDVSSVRFPEDTQIIDLEHNRDVQESLTCYLNQVTGSEDRFRLINDAGKGFIAIVLRADRSLEVRSFDRKFTLRGGILEPLRTNMILTYSAGLELSPIHQQRLELAPSLTAQFVVDGGRVRGSCLRGFVFQRFLEFKGEALKELPRLDMPLRRLEQFFIDPRTDTEYQELTRRLERTRALAQAGDAEAFKWGPALLVQAETALEQVYVGDRLLGLLVRDLRYTLEQKRTLEECPTLQPIDYSDSTN